MLQLNEQQQKAVTTTEGRVLILAGAGSGKTSVLMSRIAYLIETKGVPPEAILGLTFTNKAAQEMSQRLGGMIGSKRAKGVTLCTFHSFCMRVLRKEIIHLGYTPHFSLYNEKDIKRLLTQMARQILEQEGDLPSLESTVARIAEAKNKGLASIEISEEKATWHDKFTRDLYDQLHICMRAYNAVDFDSLLSLTVDLFQKFPQVLAIYQERYRYIMIDEYQDTNPIQYKLASFLSAKHGNLCVVGDDDQSIYGWRGAEIKHILEFKADTVIKLEQNFRSTPVILKAANSVIRHNVERHNKEMWTHSEHNNPIVMFHAPTEGDEAQAIVQRLVWYRKQYNLNWRDMAVLYRSNILTRPLETALLQAPWEKEGHWVRGVPYEMFGGTELYERSEVKDLIAYLKVILNPLDQEAMLRIINVPRRGVSENALDLLTQLNRKQQIPLWDVLGQVSSSKIEGLSDKATKGIHLFVDIIRTAREKFKPGELKASLEWLLDEIHYERAIDEDVKSDKMRDFKWENVMTCVEAIGHYEETLAQEGKSDEISLHNFLTETLLDEERHSGKGKNRKEDKVSLMTFHSAKGLEFDTCFLMGLEDHLIPHEKSILEGSVEEERRLMYVAMTRAKKHLVLSMARKRLKMGKELNTAPSRFLFEIPQELLKITPWQIIG
jgi:DNA helicase-2/ATP-dependent DNA helicase PcrA